MKITVNNITEQYPKISVKLPKELNKDEFEFVKESLDLYKEDATIKEYIDTFVQKLNEAASKQGPAPKKDPVRKKTETSKKTAPVGKKSSSGGNPPKKKKKEEITVPIEHFTLEETFLKRYLLLNEKVKTKNQVLNFIKALQKAITEKKIRKTSKYAEIITNIQNNLVSTYNSLPDKAEEIKINIDPKRVAQLQKLVGGKKIRLSVMYIKRFIGLYGRITIEKAERLLNLINKAIESGKIEKGDPYIERTRFVKKALEKYIKSGLLQLKDSELRGLAGIAGVKNTKLSKPSQIFKDTDFVSSMDLKGVQFSYMGFTGIWKKIIGDPENPFHVMIYGAGGKGKSTFAVKFAKYLSNDLGLKTLIVADEEKVSGKLKEKLSLFNAYNPNLFLTGKLPGSMKDLDIVFIDSVTSIGMEPEELESLQKKYPQCSFVYILQTNKQGKFYGKKKWEHLCDAMIRFEDGTVNVEKNRFGKVGGHRV
jgi:hypothetical protein